MQLGLNAVSAVGWSRPFIPNFAVLERPFTGVCYEGAERGRPNDAQSKKQKAGALWLEPRAQEGISAAQASAGKRDQEGVPKYRHDPSPNMGLFKVCMILHDRSGAPGPANEAVGRDGSRDASNVLGDF